MTERKLSQVVELDLDKCQNTYGVAPCTAAGAPGTECYNTFKTCQDKPNYVRGTQVVRFTNVGAPIDKTAPARPYISRVSRAVTELDPEEGMAQRSATNITLVDESCADTEFDPYIATRPAKATGTFWTRLLAREQNYVGRTARVKQGYVNQNVFGAYRTELYVIDKLAGPNAAGELTLTLKDLSKLADRSTTPTPTSGKLAIDLLIGDQVLPLQSGNGTQYPAAGYVRIGDEIIQYDGNAGDSLTLSSSTFRGRFDTAPATAKAGDGVQLCEYFENEAWSDVLQRILNNAGIDDSYIDLAGIQAEDTTWLGLDYRITRLISDPQDNSELLQGLLQAAQAMGWWDPETQKWTAKVFAPSSPAATIARTLDESGYLLDRSVATERLDELRVSFAATYFGLRNPVINVDEAKNYKFGEIAVDVDAESENEYDERRVKTFYFPWYGAANILGMRTHSRRFVARHRDAPEDISYDLDVKDNDIELGDLVDVKAKNLVNVDGTTRTVRVLVTRKENTGDRVKFKARITSFSQRYGFIAPALTPAFPNNNGYACVSSALGFMSDGSSAYLII